MAIPERRSPSSPSIPVRSLVVLLFALPGVWADLPVHCLRHQVVGDWDFTLGPLSSRRSSCGHHRPDNPNEQPKLQHFLQSAGRTAPLRVSLRDPSTAVAEGDVRGSWTMIYDEAFEVQLSDMVFLAFSNFEFIQDEAKGRTNISHCDATQIGWYHNKGRTQWGCFFAQQVGSHSHFTDAASGAKEHPKAALAQNKVTSEESSQTDDADDDESTAPEASLAGLGMGMGRTSSAAVRGAEEEEEGEEEEQEGSSEEGTERVNASAGYDRPMKSGWQQSVAGALNFMQLGWTAAVHDMFRGKTPRELNRFAGVRRSRPVPVGGFEASRMAAATRASVGGRGSDSSFSFLGVRSSHRVRHALPEGPQAFDWQSVDGQNWLQPVVSQGDCGSCYVISTVHMLTARNRIAKQNLDEVAFSVSFPLYCSEYNQGCDGGYGFLQSKWSEDVGLVPEGCAKFSQGAGSCRIEASCQLGHTRFRASNHHYVGGYYGASEERSIKEELMKHGPVVMSFEPKEDFMYYKSGVYRSGPNTIHQEWEQVDHAVLLTGYGEDSGAAYWRLQNSWGDDWGEKGFFRMARGIDESGCESIVVAAEVVEESSNAVLDDFLSQL